jgi:Peptidase family M48
MAEMDFAELAEDGVATGPTGADACPRCGESFGPSPTVTAPSFGGRVLRRCSRCGTRVASGTPAPQLVFTCETCGLPFLAEAILPHGEHHCSACTAGLTPPDLPDRDVAAAAENEVRAALSTRWRFVTSTAAQPYLDRIARQVGARIADAPASPRVVLVDTPEHRTLALPSGTLLVSLGLLKFLEDEAELAFAIGHELAHAASGEAAVRLVRLGFEATARERSASDGLCWSDAAVDLARLGYGRRRERDADACALSALIELGYEPLSAGRYLRRLHAAIARGEAAVAETAVAHPTPFDRIHRLERALSARVGSASDVPKVNREVFRRALAQGISASNLVAMELDAPQPLPWGVAHGTAAKVRSHRWRWIAGLAAAATALAALAVWLAR